MPGLKVVCLISGGKDSAFSILHCLANGHDVVALANLYPGSDVNKDAPDDVDSYMYQTIGHAVIPLYEKAFGLPLYCQEILGNAVNQEKCYGPYASSNNDETESLLPLLLRVKTHHPTVNAVSTGAILSDYQRTRVESVAMRLGLTPLSYLWQYPFLPPHTQTSLLEDMAAVGQDSRIIKVASGALDSTFLWQNVADQNIINRLDKASRRFGSVNDGAVLGEGGEYETLAIAGPAPLWKGRIVVQSDHRELVMGDAGSSSVRIVSADVDTSDTEQHDWLGVRTPPFLEPRFETILHHLQAAGTKNEQHVRAQQSDQAVLEGANGTHPEMQNQVLLPNITGDGVSAEEQTRSIMDLTDKFLQDRECSFADITYTSIILRNMNDFLAVNAVYGAYFTHPNPPARITIACTATLPPDKYLMLSFTTTKLSNPILRKGIHVQSRSYWAPANIGPYSQAIAVPTDIPANAEGGALVYISGQIPLVPAPMELATSSSGIEKDTFQLQCVLALQHAVRVGRAMQVRNYLCAIAFITADSNEVEQSRSDAAHEAWNNIHREHDPSGSEVTANDSDDPAFDVWDLQNGLEKHHAHKYHDLEMEKTASTHSQAVIPPLYVVRVDALPRNASVEWVTYGDTKETSISPIILHFDHLLRIFHDNIVSSPGRE